MSVPLGRILICDPVDGACEKMLCDHGLSVDTKYNLSEQELIEELAHHNSVIVRSETKITASVINAAPNLRIIGRAGTGVDNVDLEAASRRGILVINTPGANTLSACELTCAMILSLSRNLVPANCSMREGRWDRKLYRGRELSQKTLGIIGFGRIGQEVAHRMKAFGMNIVAFDPLLSEEKAMRTGSSKADLEDIWKLADFITVHVPLIPETRNLINKVTLSQCKEGVFIINVARGGIVDEQALLESIRTGHCAGAALDVFNEEPPTNSITRELIMDPRVISTPHLGASTTEAQVRVALEIAEQFLAVSGSTQEYQITGVVNSRTFAAATREGGVCWAELAQKLGRIIGKLTSSLPQSKLEISGNDIDVPTQDLIVTYTQLGFLSGYLRTSSSLNAVNAPYIAQDIGLSPCMIHDNGHVQEKSLLIRYGANTVRGMVYDDKVILLSINNANFMDGVILNGNISIYRTESSKDITLIVSTHVAAAVIIYDLSATQGWVVVRTSESQPLAVRGLESF